MSELYDRINSQPSNYHKVKLFMDLGLDVRYGLSAELTTLLFDLYQSSSGDNSMAGRMGCFSCQENVYRKLKDFLLYDDNLGQPLIDWIK